MFVPESSQPVPTVSAGIAVAFAVPLLAVGAREAAGAVAHVAARHLLLAGAAVETGVVGAGHGAGLAVLTVEALRTGAGVPVHQVLEQRRRVRTASGHPPDSPSTSRGGAGGGATHLAAAAILAGVAVALVGLDLAVDAGEAGLAGAGVAALPRVGARGLVLARLVIGAVVQVCRQCREKGQQGEEESGG